MDMAKVKVKVEKSGCKPGTGEEKKRSRLVNWQSRERERERVNSVNSRWMENDETGRIE
jgi:hypothetical protein